MKQRKIFDELLKQGKEKKISFLIGARQVGKTTLLKALHEELCKKGGKKGLFLDLDIFTNYEKMSSFDRVKNLLSLEGYDQKKKAWFYLFLDEFQRYGDLSMILKNIYDNMPYVKIYASGSSSLKIKNAIQESLAGRKKINNIYPLSFEEFLIFKEEHVCLAQLKQISRLKGKTLGSLTNELKEQLEEFLVFGGYPELVLKKRQQEKKAVLESIFDLYIKKDLVEYLNIRKIANVKKLIELLAVNHGKKVKYENLGRETGLHFNEIQNYLEILEETFIITILRPFFTNKNKELTKIPKIYFIDSGVRNYFINNYNHIEIREDKGVLFEGYCITELIKNGLKQEEIKFWEDKNQHEVDIIIEKGKLITPIEAKYKTTLKSNDSTGLKAFLKEYPQKRVYLINKEQQERKGGIQMLLPYRFVKEIKLLLTSKLSSKNPLDKNPLQDHTSSARR